MVMMIKLIFIFSVLLSMAYMREKDPDPFYSETDLPVVGLFHSENWDFWLLDKQVKAFIEGPYVQIQSIYTYTNYVEEFAAVRFEFPQMENDIFHRVEIKRKNQDVAVLLFDELYSPNKEYSKADPNTNEGFSYKEIPTGSLGANETVDIIFTVMKPLKVQLSQFYEFMIRPHHTPRFSTLSSYPFSWNYSIQVELKSETPFSLLANPTHNLQPELSSHTDSLSGVTTHKAFYNLTIIGHFLFSKEFKIYFGGSPFNAPQTIMATHPSNPHDHAFMFSLIPDMKYFFFSCSKQRNCDQRWNLSNPDNFLTLKKNTIQSDLHYFESEYLFVIDQSNSLEGLDLENLQNTLNKFLGALSRSPASYSILSFGSTLKLSWNRTEEKPVKLPEDTNKIMKWVKTLEAKMGEKDLLGALKYAFQEYEWSGLPKNVIILTATKDVPNAEEIIKLIQANSQSHKVCALGVDRDRGDIIHEIKKAGGCETEFSSWWSQDFYSKALNVLDATLTPPSFDLAYEITCVNDQNQPVYQEHGSSDGISKDKAFIKWVTLQDIPNLSSCQAEIFYYSLHRCSYDWKDVEIFIPQAAQPTEVWHKVAAFYDQHKNNESKRSFIVQKEELPTILHRKKSEKLRSPFESPEVTPEEEKSQLKDSLYDIYLDEFRHLQCRDPKPGALFTSFGISDIFSESFRDEDADESTAMRQEEIEEENSKLRNQEPDNDSLSSFKIICIASVFTLLFAAGLFMMF